MCCAPNFCHLLHQPKCKDFTFILKTGLYICTFRCDVYILLCTWSFHTCYSSTIDPSMTQVWVSGKLDQYAMETYQVSSCVCGHHTCTCSHVCAVGYYILLAKLKFGDRLFNRQITKLKPPPKLAVIWHLLKASLMPKSAEWSTCQRTELFRIMFC